MTTETRRAPGDRQRMQCPCFLFGAKGASTGAEYRGIKQRFPYQCNETKTSRTARRRSPWSPRRRHHQSLSQEKIAFVRISCTSCPLSNWPLWDPFPTKFWGEDQGHYKYRLATTVEGAMYRQIKFFPSRTPHQLKNTSPREAVLPLYYSSSAQEAIHHHTQE